MIDASFNFGSLAEKILMKPISMRFRDKDVDVHNAGDSAKCHRQITYKNLKYQESNPIDYFGMLKMKMGSWIENGIKYDIMCNGSLYGMHLMSTQGDAGEHGTFYGANWHGFRDFDTAILTNASKLQYKPLIMELKTKVGISAAMTMRETPWSKSLKIPDPDTTWGYCQQLSLYMRNAYMKTKDNPKFASPIIDGMLLYYIFHDDIRCFVEFYCEYKPKTDSCHFYRAHTHGFPQCSGAIDLTINLKDIADRFLHQDEYLNKRELAPPEFERKYAIDDPRLYKATKKDLELAIKGNLLIGDMQCKYCNFRDKCAQDLGVALSYAPAEIKVLKQILKNK